MIEENFKSQFDNFIFKKDHKINVINKEGNPGVESITQTDRKDNSSLYVSFE